MAKEIWQADKKGQLHTVCIGDRDEPLAWSPPVAWAWLEKQEPVRLVATSIYNLLALWARLIQDTELT